MDKTKYEVKYYKNISSVYDIQNVLKKLKYKIAHLVIMSHGEKNQLYLSKEGVINSNSKELNLLANDLMNHLAPNASILLHSCLVGKGGKNANNFANSLAKKLPGHIIYGAEEEIKRGDLSLEQIFISEDSGSLLPIYFIENYELYDFCYRKNSKEKLIKC